MPPDPPIRQHLSRGPTPLSQALKDAVQAANTRAKEGHQIFAPIAALWDDYLQSEDVRKLPAQLRKPLIALCYEMSQTATRHFDAYIKGSRPSHAVKPYTKSTELVDSDTDDSTPLTSTRATTPTYAQKAASRPPPQAVRAPKPQLKATTAKPRPDTRLFLRVGPEHYLREAGPFAVLSRLKNALGQDASILREVLEVKSGFALCTDSIEGLTALKRRSVEISQVFAGCTVETQPAWTTYRLLNVPRTVNTLDGLGQVVSNSVTDQILAESICASTNQTLVRAIETNESIVQGLYNTSWIASFTTEAHTPLPRTLRILGTTVTAIAFKTKPKVIQCTKCYQWHNSRSCIRPQRCRLCGSTSHVEEHHSTRCATPHPHQCPHRCLHCGGPHAADDRRCPLKLTFSGPKTRAERRAILETSKLARIRACTAVNCSKEDPISIQIDSPSPPSTPTCNGPALAPLTPSGPRYTSIGTNRFSSLPYEL